MTTDEKIELGDAKITKELNKVKAYCTKLAKALTKAGVEVPATNWSKEEPKEENPEPTN